MIGKPKANGMRSVWVYDPRIKRKRYVGQRDTARAARRLESEKMAEFAGAVRDGSWTVDRWATKWLDEHHGANTKRPSPTTYAVNEQNIRRFRREHGTRLLSSITRDDAYAIATARPHEARSIAAMLATAVDNGHCTVNPFLKLAVPRSSGRSEIDPLTEDEVEQLAGVALATSGHWGQELSALIRWLAWTGMRPGEVGGLRATDIDWRAGTVRIERNRRNDGTLGPVKTSRNRTIPLADQAAVAARTLRRTSGQLFRTPTGQDLRPNSLNHYWVPVRTAFTAQLDQTHWLRRRLEADPRDHLDPYELRHHCGSMLADRGLSSADIAAYLGNSVSVCERIYIHPYRDRQQARIREALNRVARPQEETSVTDLPDGDGQHEGQAAS